ncbi:hypothetical protein CEXT_640701 [Caerostris extrusa]|uniref:Uncharacterized protein n=1 Tax=Caerostris extrusa TaxID=172846 RepID=A0AAV4MUR3_CAEEX|nr:hypothetical protein CEXT_640701 [Caerostris extrusa]
MLDRSARSFEASSQIFPNTAQKTKKFVLLDTSARSSEAATSKVLTNSARKAKRYLLLDTARSSEAVPTLQSKKPVLVDMPKKIVELIEFSTPSSPPSERSCAQSLRVWIRIW